MKPTTFFFALPLAALGLGGLLLTGCAAGQPMMSERGAKRSFGAVAMAPAESTEAPVMFAVKKKSRRMAVAEPAALVVAEPAPEPEAAVSAASAVKPQAAAEPAPAPQTDAAETTPETQPEAAAEPAPKKRGPLTRTEEKEIDNQVMP